MSDKRRNEGKVKRNAVSAGGEAFAELTKLYNNLGVLHEVAIRKVEREQLLGQVYADLTSAALGMMKLRNFVGAEAMLLMVRRLSVDALRDRVAHEPGGVFFREPGVKA